MLTLVGFDVTLDQPLGQINPLGLQWWMFIQGPSKGCLMKEKDVNEGPNKGCLLKEKYVNEGPNKGCLLKEKDVIKGPNKGCL
jgi:hypothetical protein